jgi:hypothetical protein
MGPHRTSTARRRRKHRESGAVFIEAIMVIMTLTMLFMGILFAVHYYKLRLQALRSARVAAATMAFVGCDGGVNPSGILVGPDAKNVTTTSGGPSEASDMKPELKNVGSQIMEIIKFAINHVAPIVPSSLTVRSEGKMTVESAGASLTGPAKSTSYILCNSKTKEGNPADLLGLIPIFRITGL